VFDQCLTSGFRVRGSSGSQALVKNADSSAERAHLLSRNLPSARGVWPVLRRLWTAQPSGRQRQSVCPVFDQCLTSL
jgi:hypothetical protein